MRGFPFTYFGSASSIGGMNRTGRKHFAANAGKRVIFAASLSAFLLISTSTDLAQRPAASAALAQANNLMKEGKTLYEQGTESSFRASMKKFEAARGLYRKIGTKRLEAGALQEIGKVSNQLGENQRAIDALNQALTIRQRQKIRYSMAQTLSMLGLVYFELGNTQRALEYCTQALTIWRAIGSKGDRAATLNIIGLIHTLRNDHLEALRTFNQSLTFRRLAKDKAGEAITLRNIGSVYSNLRDKTNSLRYFDQALKLFKSIPNKTGEASTLSNIGKLYADLGETEQATSYLQSALPIHREAGDVEREALTLSRLQDAWSAANKPSLAILYGKESVNKYQEMRSNIRGLDKVDRQTFLQTVAATYRSLANIYIAQGQLFEAQAVLDLLKEEEFRTLITLRGGNPLFSLPYSGAEEQAIKAVDSVAFFSRELSELQAKANATAADKKRILEIQMAEIPAANVALQRTLDALQKTAPNVEKLLAERRKENIQSILPELGDNVVALYTVVGEAEAKTPGKNQIGWVMAVFPNGTSKAYPIDTANLNQTVFDFRLELQGPNCDPEDAKNCKIKKLAQELYRKLFLQVSPGLQNTLETDLETYFKNQNEKILMWSLDGVLRYVPMAALHDGRGFLVEKYTNTLFNTASLGSLKDAGKPAWKVLGLGVSAASNVTMSDGKTAKFDPLAQAETELRSLVQENKPEDIEGLFPGVLKLNAEFDKTALFEGMLEKPNLVHISGHFSFNTFNEEQSFLLLGNNGKLEIRELEPFPTLFAGVDLLSIAACETAIGSNASPISQENKTNGKEVEGFAYVAQKKGAKSVMASLWRVHDRGTKELMLKFYELRKANPDRPKAETLRQAQLALLKGNHDPRGLPLSYPYFWAPFVLIGNWR